MKDADAPSQPPQPTSARRHRPALSGRFTMAINDPNSAGRKRHDGRPCEATEKRALSGPLTVGY